MIQNQTCKKVRFVRLSYAMIGWVTLLVWCCPWMAQAYVYWPASHEWPLARAAVEVKQITTRTDEDSPDIPAVTQPLIAPPAPKEVDSWIGIQAVAINNATDSIEIENPPDVSLPENPAAQAIINILIDQQTQRLIPGLVTLLPPLQPLYFYAVDQWLMTPMEPRQWGFLAIGELLNTHSLLVLRLGSIIVAPMGSSLIP